MTPQQALGVREQYDLKHAIDIGDGTVAKSAAKT
jgi:hypothetical protein